jgi:hypothetical protein
MQKQSHTTVYLQSTPNQVRHYNGPLGAWAKQCHLQLDIDELVANAPH